MTGPRARRPAELWPAGDPRYRVRHVSVDGASIRVVERGDPGSAPAVLVPGWACSAYVFHANVGAVLASGHRVVIVEPRGLGASSKPRARGDYAASALVRHLLAALDALALDRVALVGLSMGGGLTLRLALAAPERVTRLVLFDPAGIGRIPLAALGRLPAAGALARLLARLPSAVHRAIVALGMWSIYGDASRVRREDVEEFRALAELPGYYEAQAAMLREYDWRPIAPEALAALRAPTLLVRGTRDRLVLVRDLEALRRSLPPSVRLLPVDGAGHAANMECAGEIAGAVESFLRGAAAG
ncbi:MAG TPA: alpha/beta hydrolase [Gemmatimonadaceae bacterium]